MKKIIIILATIVSLASCSKTDTPKPTTNPTDLIGKWVSKNDANTTKTFTKMNILDSTGNKMISSHAYTPLAYDTFLVNGEKVIIKIEGNTLCYADAPYNNTTKWTKRQ